MRTFWAAAEKKQLNAQNISCRDVKLSGHVTAYENKDTEYS